MTIKFRESDLAALGYSRNKDEADEEHSDRGDDDDDDHDKHKARAHSKRATVQAAPPIKRTTVSMSSALQAQAGVSTEMLFVESVAGEATELVARPLVIFRLVHIRISLALRAQTSHTTHIDSQRGGSSKRSLIHCCRMAGGLQCIISTSDVRFIVQQE